MVAVLGNFAPPTFDQTTLAGLGSRASFRVAFGCPSGDQNLLGGCPHIIFQHRVFARVLEQVIHSRGRLFSEQFKEWGARAYASFEDLEDIIHAICLYL